LAQWQVWVTLAVGVAVISVPIIFKVFQKNRSNENKVRSVEPIFRTVAHYIERACAYVETGERGAYMDITEEKFERVLCDLNRIKCFDVPSPKAAKATNLLRIAVGRASSGLGQWLQDDERLNDSGLQDLQRAKKISEEALALLDIQVIEK
jgi:hypothetical protein